MTSWPWELGWTPCASESPRDRYQVLGGAGAWRCAGDASAGPPPATTTAETAAAEAMIVLMRCIFSPVRGENGRDLPDGNFFITFAYTPPRNGDRVVIDPLTAGWLPAVQELPQRGQRARDVRAADADPEPVGRQVSQLGGVDAGREQQHPALLHRRTAELLRPVRPQVARIADAAPVRRRPLEQVGVPGEELVEVRQVGRDQPPGAREQAVRGLDRDAGQHLARGRAADRAVVLDSLGAVQHRVILAGDPADAQARQAVGLGDAVQRDRPLVPVGGLRQRPRRVELRAAVDLVAEQVDAAAAGQLD